MTTDGDFKSKLSEFLNENEINKECNTVSFILADAITCFIRCYADNNRRRDAYREMHNHKIIS